MSFPEAIDLRRARLPHISLRPIAARFHKPSRWTLLISIVVLAAVLAGSFMLLRNSSLVRVQQVKVVGLSGYYDKDARNAVVSEAMQMTTMNFDPARVEDAASGFVDVAGVKVKTNFPHEATIYVDVRRPVLVARLNGRTVTLSQKGEVITAATSIAGLPHIEASGDIVNNRVTGGKALAAATLLGAAPDVLMRKVDAIRWGKFGIVVSMEKGPDLYFGTASDAKLKWRDASTVLASGDAEGAAYLDLRVPGRPAIGGLGAAPSTITGQPVVEDPTSDETTSTDTGAADTTSTDTPAATETPSTDTTTQQQTTTTTPTQQVPSQAAGGAGPNG